jgi:hypothetical protein
MGPNDAYHHLGPISGSLPRPRQWVWTLIIYPHGWKHCGIYLGPMGPFRTLRSGCQWTHRGGGDGRCLSILRPKGQKIVNKKNI